MPEIELNPGSFNEFREKLDPTISDADAVSLYSAALMRYRELVAPVVTAPKEDFCTEHDYTVCIDEELIANG